MSKSDRCFGCVIRFRMPNSCDKLLPISGAHFQVNLAPKQAIKECSTEFQILLEA